MPKYAARTDSNHAEIRQCFRDFGATVADTFTLGRGFPDMVVGHDGQNYLIEVKAGKGQLTKAERVFCKEWRGNYHIVRTFEDVVAVLGIDVD